MRTVGALAGLMACALARHVLGALTSDPWWIGLAVTAVFGAALSRAGRVNGLPLCVFLGIGCGLMLPRELPPPEGSVITHVPSRFAHQDLFDALEQLDEHPLSLEGRRITVTGSWSPAHGAAAAAVSRRVMTCCAADAVDVGFDVAPARPSVASAGSEVRVTGVVRAFLRDGETRYTLTDAAVTTLSAGSSVEK